MTKTITLDLTLPSSDLPLKITAIPQEATTSLIAYRLEHFSEGTKAELPCGYGETQLPAGAELLVRSGGKEITRISTDELNTVIASHKAREVTGTLLLANYVEALMNQKTTLKFGEFVKEQDANRIGAVGAPHQVTGDPSSGLAATAKPVGAKGASLA